MKATVEIVVVIEPGGQGSNPENFAACLAMIDNIETAIAANAGDYGIDLWNIVLQGEYYGEKRPYWQLVARIEGSGT